MTPRAGTQLFIGNLDFSLDAQALREAFQQYGEITEAIVIRDRATSRSKGYGFVAFTTVEAAQAGLQMDGADWLGRPMLVRIALPKRERVPETVEH
jgi:cold-inducible RNA-binding protein